VRVDINDTRIAGHRTIDPHVFREILKKQERGDNTQELHKNLGNYIQQKYEKLSRAVSRLEDQLDQMVSESAQSEY
jgi:hypothetical protein